VTRRKLISAGFVVIAIAILGILAWLAGTTSGLRFLAARALPMLPVTVEPSAITGRLIGPLSVRGIEVQADGLTGTIERVDFDWRPMSLLRRTVRILHLDIEAPRLTVQPQEGSDPGEGSEPFSLPWTIVVDRLSVREGAVFMGEDLALEGLRLDAAGRAHEDRLELTQFDFSSTRGEATGHARASMRAPEDPWDIDLRWRVRLDEGVLAGHTQVAGKLADLAVDQTFAELASGRIEGRITGLPERPSWSLGLSLEPLTPRRGPWPEALDGLAADLRLEGRLEDSRLTGRVAVPAVVPTEIEVDGEAGWDDGIATIRRLELALGERMRFAATGRLDAAEPLSGEFTVNGEALQWPLEGQPEIEVPRLSIRGSGAEDRWQVGVDARAQRPGLPEMDLQAALLWDTALLTVERLELKSPDGEVNVTLSGALDTSAETLQYRVVAGGDLRVPDQPSLTLRLNAEGDAEGLVVEALDAQLLGGTVEGHGRITWAGEEAANFSLTFAGLDPSGLHADFPGRLAGSLELRGAPGIPEGLDIVLDSLRGELRSLPVSGRADVNLSGDRLEVRAGTLAVGENSFQGSGRLDADTVALNATLELASLAELHAAARGNLQATAEVSGSRNEPRIILEANGADLGWQAWRAEQLHVDLDVDLAGDRASDVVAEIVGAAQGPGPGATLRVSGEGTPRDHRARLELTRPGAGQQAKVEFEEGGLADGRWAGRLSALSLADAQQELWTLQQSAGLSIAADEVVLRDACMDGTFGRLCTEGRWNDSGAWGGRTTLGELELGPLSRWIGAGVVASGVLTGELAVAADEDGFQDLSGALSLTEGELRFVEEEGGVLMGWREGTMVFEGDHDEAQVTLTLLLANTDRLEGRLSAGWNAEDPPLDGRLETELQELQVITEFLPDVADLEGRARLEGSVSGTLGAPRLTGRFEWLDGAARVAALGIRPEDIHVVAELEDAMLEFRAEGRSGDGSFRADGRFNLGAETVEGVASLSGDKVLVANLPAARLTASPELELTYASDGIAIDGTVTIPSALISGLGPGGAVTTTEDEVIVGARERAEEEGVAVTSRVRVKVGPDVRIQAFGLKGTVEGNILTVTEPKALPWGRGELRVVDGTFSAFGQQLEIETGRLIYTGGPLENPGLQIRAIRQVDEITAGAHIRGTLQQPEISLYSDPPMARAEVLSYLTLGKGLDELQGGERTTVNQAANSLALSGGGLIARDLGKKLGFDEVAVTADEVNGGTSLVVGKDLGAGLYVSYGLGLFDTINTLRLRYQINKRLSLEATSGEEVATDLFYTFERD
jgi:translocation and assembly module TamB